MKISIIVPTFCEEGNLCAHYLACMHELKELKKRYSLYNEYEYLVIDNCSTDSTVAVALTLRESDPNIRIFVNDQNYGPIWSPFCGLLNAKGDAALLIAADLQEPVNMLIPFVSALELGYEAAIGYKKNAEKNKLMWYLRGTYYWILKKIGLVKLSMRYSGFGLYSRKLIEVFRTVPITEPSLRVLLPICSSKIKAIPYEHQARLHGTTSYSLYNYVREALKTIIRNSNRFPTYAGKLSLFLALLSFVSVPLAISIKILAWNSMAPGIATLIILILLNSSVILGFLALIMDRQNQILSRLEPASIHVHQSMIYE